MKFIVSLILIALLSFASCLYFPWWNIAIVTFVVAVAIPQNPFVSFVTAFLAVAFLWAGLAFWLSNNNGHLLAHKVSLIILKIDSPYLLIAVTGIVGGVIAGFGALTGSFLRKKKRIAVTY